MSEQGTASVAPTPSNGLTPAEEAYFASGGTVTEGLTQEAPAAAPITPAPTPAVAPNAGAQPAPSPAPDDDEGEEIAGAGGQKRRMVDYRALKETRTKFKELQDRYESDRSQWVKDRETQARLDERLRLLNEALSPDPAFQQQQQEEVPPNPEEDIFGFVRHLNKQLEAIKGQTQEVAGTVAANDEESRLRTAYQNDARRFAMATPDFGAAYAHMLKARGDMLTMQGFDEKQISEILLNEERGLVRQAFQSGKSPAELVYGMAKSFGYQPAPLNPNPTPVPVPTVPATGVPVPATPAAAASDEIARIQAAQAASRSLSNGGGAAAAPMTVESLANMSQAEFNQFVRRNPEIARQLMGG
jgi:hypothetical protein